MIVEPVAGNMGLVVPARGLPRGPARADRGRRRAARLRRGDDRLPRAPGGAQALYGITPDLTTLGKVIGGGLPVGAYGGRREIMELVAPAGPVYQAGTLSGNPLAMAAGIATLRALAEPGVWDGIVRAASGSSTGSATRRRRRASPVQPTQRRNDVGLFFTERRSRTGRTRSWRDTERFAALPPRDARARRLPRAVAVRGVVPLDRARRRRDRRDDRRRARGVRLARLTSTLRRREGAARHDVLPARGRRRRAAPAEARAVPARARHRDARARAGRPEVGAPRPRAPRSDQAWIHRVRYVGPKARKPAEELRGDGRARAGARSGAGRRPAGCSSPTRA